jgi:tRNA uridine 5-carbamoylmethylation protein Kti12
MDLIVNLQNYNYLLILTGLPASGKSTFAHLFKRVLEKRRNLKVRIVDPDKIRNKLFPEDFNYRNEKFIRQRSLIEVKSALKEGYVVISDDLNYYTSMRHNLKKIAEKLKKEFIIIHISTPFEICINWNEKRGLLIPNTVISAVYRKFDKFNTYQWDIPFKSLNLSKIEDLESEINSLISQIEQYFNLKRFNLKKRKIKNKKIEAYNNELDKITRVVVGKLFKKQIYHTHKKRILILRKEFIKKNLDNRLKSTEISDHFISFLHEHLN